MVLSSKFQNEAVAKVFASYPEKFREKLLFLRQLIFTTAANIQQVGQLEETLKWGEPSYLTSHSKTGSMIRLGWSPKRPNQYAIYFHCKTTLIEQFKVAYGELFHYGGNRSIIFCEDDKIPTAELADCIAMALTYYLNKKK